MFAYVFAPMTVSVCKSVHAMPMIPTSIGNLASCIKASVPLRKMRSQSICQLISKPSPAQGYDGEDKTKPHRIHREIAWVTWLLSYLKMNIIYM